MQHSNFWNWSVRVYENPKTKSACLNLQNRFGHDVNVLLWLGWLAQNGKSPTPQSLDEQKNIEKTWQTGLIHGVRSARNEVSTGKQQNSSRLKAEFLKLELILEKHEQQALEALGSYISPIKQPKALCLHNLSLIPPHQEYDTTQWHENIQALCDSFF